MVWFWKSEIHWTGEALKQIIQLYTIDMEVKYVKYGIRDQFLLGFLCLLENGK